MNRRTALKALSLTALGLSGLKPLSLKASAQSDDAPDLSGITRVLCALPAGDWLVTVGPGIGQKVQNDLLAYPEQIPASDGVFMIVPDLHPWRYSARRKLIPALTATPVATGYEYTFGPEWQDAPFERVNALKMRKPGFGYDSAVAFCVNRVTFEVDAYRPEALV